jgi:high frequency lysogenization protein
MKHDIRERCIGLAGVYQACALVQQIASRGMANSAVIESSLESLFRFDSRSAEEVFGTIAGVGSGLRTMRDQLHAPRDARHLEITRYVISLLVLERNLIKNRAMLDTLTTRLREVENSLAYFSLSHDSVFAKLGQLYQDTISTLGPRVMVSGEQPHLSNAHNASKVRALLLAGIRAAVLWQQCGGTRWQLLFGRKHYLAACERLLTEL